MEHEAEGRSRAVETNHLEVGSKMEFGLTVRISFTPFVYCPNALGHWSPILPLCYHFTVMQDRLSMAW